MEDLAYRRLLDQYYLREGPLPADIQVTAKLVRMRSMAADVESVLKEFFILTDNGWIHERCETEIAHMQDKQAKARASAAASVKSRQAFADKKMKSGEASANETGNGRSTDVPENPTDVQLPTPTPTPTVNPKNQGAAKATRFDPLSVELGCVPAEAWNRWIAYRRSRRLTSTEATVAAQVAALNAWAADGSPPESVIDTSIEKGWQGLFKPRDSQPNAPPRMSASDASKLAAARTIFGTEVEGIEHGQIINGTAIALGREDFQGIAGKLRQPVPEPVEDRAACG
jgi:uncharacterized protein YdaU (DUF1376 family)